MSFRYRLALFLVVTLIAVQALTALLAYSSLRHDLVERGKRELTSAAAIFARQLDFISEQIANDVQVLSLDFALRTAIAQRDYGTEISVLRNHGHRISASRMMIVELGGRTTVDTAGVETGRIFPYSTLLSRAGVNDKAAALATMDGQIYWIVIVPVRAPLPIAFIAAFIPVDDALLDKLRVISSSPRAIALTTIGANGHWLIAAESAMRSHQIGLPSAPRVSPSATVTTDDGKEYLAVTTPLKTIAGSRPVQATLYYPLDDALAAYREAILSTLGVLLLGLLAMMAGITFIVRGVSRPLEILSRAARRIATGDYTPLLRITQRDEVGQLGEALVMMTSAIAERERSLQDAVVAMETAKNEAERANQAKSQFLSNMSHELRTPLNAVVGFSEMIDQEVLGPIGVRRYVDYARDIHDAGEHLLKLVERMLDLAESDADRLVIKREKLFPDAQLTGAVESLREFAVASGVQIVCDGRGISDIQIDGDAPRLQKAFYNILHNAIRFTPKGGLVTIARHVEAGRFILKISDSGIGMDEGLLAAVVRPFHRLRSAFDGKNQGAGLGLPFAKMIIERHGGTFSLESVIGTGTTATIVLPLASAASEAA